MGRNEALRFRHRVSRTRNAQPEPGNPEIFRLAAPELCVGILGGEPWVYYVRLKLVGLRLHLSKGPGFRV